jgi:hypothetical protein
VCPARRKGSPPGSRASWRRQASPSSDVQTTEIARLPGGPTPSSESLSPQATIREPSLRTPPNRTPRSSNAACSRGVQFTPAHRTGASGDCNAGAGVSGPPCCGAGGVGTGRPPRTATASTTSVRPATSASRPRKGYLPGCLPSPPLCDMTRTAPSSVSLRHAPRCGSGGRRCRGPKCASPRRDGRASRYRPGAYAAPRAGSALGLDLQSIRSTHEH